MTQLTPNMLAVFPPDDAYNFRIEKAEGVSIFRYNYNYSETDEFKGWDIQNYVLPPGSWSILGTAKDGVPEFECEGLVEKIHVEEAPSPGNDWSGGYHYAYVYYMSRGEYAGWQGYAGAFRKAKQSFSSLLHSCGCGVGRWVILIKKDEK